MKKEPWREKEKELVESAGGRLMPGSGNQWKSPGDGANRYVSIEVKTTEKDSISIKGEWLDKIKREACFNQKQPILMLDINGRQWGAAPIGFFNSMLKVWEDMQT